jgi:hypothetical protein
VSIGRNLAGLRSAPTLAGEGALRFSRGLSRDNWSLRFPEPRAVARTRLDSREVPVPFRVFYCPTSSALLASGAPPSSFVTTSGFSSSGFVAEQKSHDLPSWG